MTPPKKDILVEIPSDQLPKLRSFFAEKAPWAPYLVTLVATAIKWKQLEKYKNSLSLYSPNNCWKEDGTVIILITMFTQDVYVFTLDDRCINLEKGLSETKLIRYDRRTTFAGLNNKRVPIIIRKHIDAKQLKVTGDFTAFLYALPPEEAAKFTPECPPDVYIGRLQGSDAAQIDGLWPHRCPDSDKYIASFLDLHGGYGLFLKSTNRMVAWLVRHVLGNMTMLQTEEPHKRRGYASLVTKALAKEIAEEGYWPVAMVITTNDASIRLFEQLGFRMSANCTFIETE